MRTSYKYDIIVMKISPRPVFIPGKNQTTCFFSTKGGHLIEFWL